jgi:predicted PurR-regulated permease PerM
MPPWVPRAVLVLMLGVAGLYIVFRMAVRLRGLLVLLLVAFFLSLALEPAVNNLARRGWKRGTATGLLFGVVVLFTVAFTAGVGSLFVNEVGDLIVDVPRYVEDTVRWANGAFGLDLSSDLLGESLRDSAFFQRLTSGLASTAFAAGTSLLGLVASVFTVGLFAFYLTADGPKLRRTICSVLPPPRQRRMLFVWDLATQMTGHYLYSRGLLAIFSAVAHAVAFVVIGVPNAVVLAAWVGLVSQFVPTIGTYLAAILPLVVALANDPLDAVWVLVFVVLYQQVEAYVLTPRVTSQTLALNAAVAFGAVLAGGYLLGAVGAILALPAAAVIQALITASARRHEVVASPLTDDPATPRTPAPHAT